MTVFWQQSPNSWKDSIYLVCALLVLCLYYLLSLEPPWSCAPGLVLSANYANENTDQLLVYYHFCGFLPSLQCSKSLCNMVTRSIWIVSLALLFLPTHHLPVENWKLTMFKIGSEGCSIWRQWDMRDIPVYLLGGCWWNSALYIMIEKKKWECGSHHVVTR